MNAAGVGAGPARPGSGHLRRPAGRAAAAPGDLAAGAGRLDPGRADALGRPAAAAVHRRRPARCSSACGGRELAGQAGVVLGGGGPAGRGPDAGRQPAGTGATPARPCSPPAARDAGGRLGRTGCTAAGARPAAGHGLLLAGPVRHLATLVGARVPAPAAGIAALTAWRALRTPTPTLPGRSVGPRRGVAAGRGGCRLALVLAAVATLGAYTVSSSAGLDPGGEFPLPVLPGHLHCRRCSGRCGRRPAGRPAAARPGRTPVAVLAAMLGTAGRRHRHLAGARPCRRPPPRRPAPRAGRHPRQLGVRHVRAGYWTCNRLTFASAEQVVCAVVDDNLRPGFDRYPAYRREVDSAAAPAWVAPAGSPLAEGLDERQRSRRAASTWSPSRAGASTCRADLGRRVSASRRLGALRPPRRLERRRSAAACGGLGRAGRGGGPGRRPRPGWSRPAWR